MNPSRKILSTGVLVGIIVVSLLSGLALVVRSLKNAKLQLNLDLRKGDNADHSAFD